MADPYLGEIKINAFGYPPKHWAQCNGQTLPINQNQALFALLGTTYGGNGVNTFALPNLLGCVPIHVGNGFVAGQTGGEVTHTLTINEIPTHTHAVNVSTAFQNGNVDPTNRFLGGTAGLYANLQNLTPMNPSTVSQVGQSLPHENMQPFLTLNFCIALTGIFPSRN